MSAHRLVVVNDDPVQLAHLGGLLADAGYHVSTFTSAGDALSRLARGSEEVDLFVVDLHMPGIDGWKLCRLLRSPELARFNATPIVVVSATFTGDDVATITRELGANSFLEAPFEAHRLIAHVAEVLAGRIPRADPLVLIVEDDSGVRTVLDRCFRLHGFRVALAADVDSARGVVARQRVDVAVVDYHLPDGACEDLVDEIRDPNPSACVLVMTGDEDPGLPVRLLASGVDAFLRKPFDPTFAVELARKASRERALLRIETVLEARTRELKASEARYRSLFDTIPDLVLALDDEGRIAEANPEAVAALGASAPGVTGRRFVDLVSHAARPRLRGWLAAVEQGRLPGPFLLELDAGVASERAFELTARAIELRGLPALLLVGRDVAERRRAEAERRQLEAQMQHAQRLESLGVLAGGVAHDFNNLLVGILGNASLAAMDLPDDSSVRDAVRQIEVAALRAAELTQQILAFAGKSRVTVEEFDLAGLVREMGQLVEPAVSKKARIAYALPAGLPAVRGDPGQIRQVAMNLIMNASDALAGRPGRIDVSVGVRLVGPEFARDVVGGERPAPGPYLALEVSDDGAGMDERTRLRIFEPFFTTKAAGRGLGLAATLGIVRTHGGFIAVRSETGVGTTMTVLFPPGSPIPDPCPDPPGRRGEWWNRGGRVLVVDDEPTVRSLAGAALRGRGFTVVEAVDGAAGLRMATDPGTPPDLVLLDLTMPELDGMEALAEIRRRFPRLPVLMSSGNPPDGTLDALRADGVTAFLRKPYSVPELLDAATDLLRGQAPPRRALA